MASLFEDTRINGLEVKNRFVRSATWEGMAEEDGACTERLVRLIAELADGQVGLIIASHAYVSREGQATPWQLGIYQDDLIAPLRRMTDAVHERDGKIVAQLAHAGCFADRRLTGAAPLAVSLVDEKGRLDHREASLEELQTLSGQFAAAAARARAAGFDGVQIHAAHGYLLSQVLSPAFNQRTDGYGGTLAGRARLLLEVLAAVRGTVGADFPVLVKINSADHVDNGLTLDEVAQVARMLQDGGIDAIEVSGGTLVSGALGPVRQKISGEETQAYFRYAARHLKTLLQVPVMLVGGIRSPALAERLLSEGVADYFSMSRPFIREPHLIKRWQAGDTRPAACVSDNACNKAARSGEGIYCVVEKKGSGRIT
jgi:2,4-dienoyl-CoA reductase-like NADH-dependent reductase (Old Yellow Enzyme family)